MTQCRRAHCRQSLKHRAKDGARHPGFQAACEVRSPMGRMPSTSENSSHWPPVLPTYKRLPTLDSGSKWVNYPIRGRRLRLDKARRGNRSNCFGKFGADATKHPMLPPNEDYEQIQPWTMAVLSIWSVLFSIWR